MYCSTELALRYCSMHLCYMGFAPQQSAIYNWSIVSLLTPSCSPSPTHCLLYISDFLPLWCVARTYQSSAKTEAFCRIVIIKLGCSPTFVHWVCVNFYVVEWNEHVPISFKLFQNSSHRQSVWTKLSITSHCFDIQCIQWRHLLNFPLKLCLYITFCTFLFYFSKLFYFKNIT